ncbi:dimethylarginine dimethylaminohydrolase family protein [Halalkalibacter krulwichiae]|uniref:N(G),N(G)-dimethylarginine dimethylaminohydrolase n=1 Tax=Halalkalibacter krulwichiae TaxID=199441 RepID=A0A1X9MI74_9BACI|nr:arginine deiminase family protein [Halalkalibacter krulwichiae]ARK32340.1 N(G),N(G)-dimethylarginine dimethylaminohydrolase [Halalkalibacter krulwichiae]
MSYCSSMFQPMQHVIVKHPKQAFISQEHLSKQWKVFNYVEEPNLEEAISEYHNFLHILEQHVPHVEFLPQSSSVGLDSLYAHDPVKFTHAGAILLKSGKKARQPEVEVYREFLIERGIPIIGELQGDAVADGGDLVWLDDRTLAVGLGYRTNAEAIQQLKEMTAPYVDEFIVVQLPHDRGVEECLHLMSLISIVDHDLAVVYSPLMPVFFRNLLIERGFRLLEVTKEEYERLGSNVLALAPRICLVVAGNPLIKQQLVDAGATVFEYKGEEISYKGTGGPTCLTCPVVRINN